MSDQSLAAAWRMGGITVEAVEDYIYSLLPPRDEVLAEMHLAFFAAEVPGGTKGYECFPNPLSGLRRPRANQRGNLGGEIPEQRELVAMRRHGE